MCLCVPRFEGPVLLTRNFRAATIQGEATFLITGGFDMHGIEGNIGTKYDSIIMYNGKDKVWEAKSRMKRSRGGHIVIPMYQTCKQ